MKFGYEKLTIEMAIACCTLGDLAFLSGLSTSTMNNLKNGINPRPKTVGLIAKALDIPVESLIEND